MQGCTYSSGWSWNVNSRQSFAWSSSCSSTQWLRMFLLSPPGCSCPDCYGAQLIVWMAVTWLLIKLRVPTMSFIFMWLEAHKVTLPIPVVPSQRKPLLMLPSLSDKRVAVQHSAVGYWLPGPVRAGFALFLLRSVQRTLLSLRTKLMFVFGRCCWLYSWASKGISRAAIFLGNVRTEIHVCWTAPTREPSPPHPTITSTTFPQR